MSAAQPKPTETKPSEPSMEEILASIRRIISDDQAARPAAKAPEPPAAPAPPAPEARQPDPPAPPAPPPAVVQEEEEEILDLSPKVERDREPHFITDDVVGADVSFDDTSPPQGQDDIDALMSEAAEVAPEPPVIPPAPPVMATPAQMPELPEPDNDRLLSPNTGRMVSSAFNSLANTVLSNNARTLDDLVHEMLRPLIKSWLDENLPTVVERLVRAEIERVARGGR